MRKFLGILLAVVLCLSSVSALAAYNDHGLFPIPSGEGWGNP